jgi:hypothetical protein
MEIAQNSKKPSAMMCTLSDPRDSDGGTASRCVTIVAKKVQVQSGRSQEGFLGLDQPLIRPGLGRREY